ncbi:hypothetical protein [Paludibacterium paludis]|uniref:Uncharacterized protein n=1 Tax=Paludibacterium paludis TaxID=1225769 RepID=A0A918UA49_9NEIS|nr:hypothetical protein [Paludibacterium paludis]GGY19322.1 hypothetical protein GCM10011289_23570 [Paludibacterium paludis]
MAHEPHHKRTYRFTLLTASAAQRALWVLAVLALLWSCVIWALEGGA